MLLLGQWRVWRGGGLEWHEVSTRCGTNGSRVETGDAQARTDDDDTSSLVFLNETKTGQKNFILRLS